MCDVSNTRRSRRKQHAPSRHFNTSTTMTSHVFHVDNNMTINNQASNTEATHLLASSTSSHSTSNDSNSLSIDVNHREISEQIINPLRAIYLPVALHNHSINSIQVLGYPQLLIPVAVHPHAEGILKPCILIDEFMARNITVPKEISLGETQCHLNITTTVQQPYSETSPSTSTSVFYASNRKRMSKKEVLCNIMKKKQKATTDSKPLDLTVRIRKIQQNAQSNSSNCDSTEEDNSNNDKLGSMELDKKYRCDCGVSFNSEVTLNGHKKYYCNNNITLVTPFREPQKKALYCCQQCDFLPTSASQLAQHVRVSHSAVQTYVCQICGYKGYSQRGIRSHLR
ncbi:unnamed protein product [Thelazia callipaeda]|uniref:C2H2-type domain-containing protein n=1 Tax=Thelazia callipaeda TaxID=103827 RepID=A0A0N5CYP9_THECL|nr:unnamed protein product [Thelazia callipaeda]